MENGKIELKQLLEVINRRRKEVYRIIVVAIAIAIVYNLVAPVRYEAVVNIRINPHSASEPVNPTVSAPQEDQQTKLLTTAEIIKSRSVMDAVISQLYGDLPEENRPSADALQRAVTVTPVRNTAILNIGVQANSPQEAQNLGNTLVKVFLQRMAELAQAEGKDTRVFIGERLAEAKKNLAKAEADLVAYKKDKKTISVSDQTRNFMEQQAALKKLEIENQLSVNSAGAKLADVRSQISQQNPGFVADSLLIQQYKSRLADQESELIIAKSHYSDIHPKVVGLTAAVAETRSKLNAEISHVVKAEAPSSNPVYQGMLQNRIQAEADLAVAMGQRQALSSAKAQSEADLSAIPEREQGLARVLRDYTVAEEAYTMLAKRYDQARIEEVMQPTNVQVVDMAALPDRPVRPRKVLNLAMAAVLGLFGGILLVFVLDYFRKTIDSAEDVRRYLGLRVIGSIPSYNQYNPKEKMSWWRKLWR